MKEYITRKMIEDGLMAKIILNSFEDEYLVTTIGEYWFYTHSDELQYDNVNDIPFAVLVDEIKETLDDFYRNPDMFGDEYLYYYYYLCENI